MRVRASLRFITNQCNTAWKICQREPPRHLVKMTAGIKGQTGTNCMSVLFAGGGIRGGQTYGTSDKVAAFPADRPVAPEDIAKTVYFAMGIDNLEAIDREGRPFNLLPEGRPLRDLF